MNRSALSPLHRIAIHQPALRLQRRFESNSIISKIVDKLSPYLPKRTDFGNARSLLFNCKQQADNSLWHTRGLVGTDFRSKQVLLMLHVWMLHKRLITEGKEGQRVQEALFDQLWEDTGNRIRGHGVNELSVNKYLKQVQGYSFRTCIELDHVVSILKKPTVDVKLIKSMYDFDVEPSVVGADGVLTTQQVHDFVQEAIGFVVWRQLFFEKEREDVNNQHLAVFAKYIWDEHQSIMQLPRDAVFESRIAFGPVPTWGGAAVAAEDKSERHVHTHTPATKGEWKEATAMDGKPYYWNTVTREARWDKPKDFVAKE